MTQVQRLSIALAAAMLIFIAVKWVVLWRRLNAAAASARAVAGRHSEQDEGTNHLNIDNPTSDD